MMTNRSRQLRFSWLGGVGMVLGVLLLALLVRASAAFAQPIEAADPPPIARAWPNVESLSQPQQHHQEKKPWESF